tara:strand:- start:4023 stop:5306 length:1284 start_codon:yes stop_codon:yes gene_type:complete
VAYFLQFDGVDDHVVFTTGVNIPSANGNSFTYVFDINYNGAANQMLFADPTDFNNRVNIVSTTSIVFRAGSSNRTFTLISPLSTGRQTLKIRKNGFAVGVYDGSNTLLSNVLNVGTKNTVYGFGMDSQGSAFGGDLYSAQIYSDFTETTLVADWQSDLSGGTGVILTDAVSANNGTLTNFTGTTDSWWVFYSSGSAIELTPTTINSNSQSFNPLIQYASLLSLTPGVVNSASSSLNPVIQYSASLLLAPSAVNSSSSTLNPNISFSAALNIFPTIVNSSSISLDPVVKYISALDLLPGAVNSNSLSLDPVVNYSSILSLSPNVVNSNSVSFNPSIDYTSALILSPATADSSSVSLDPLVEYKAVINITAQVINSASVSLNPSISTGATQDVGLVSAGFANDLYSVQYEASGVTASYQLSNILVNFKG